MEFITAHNLSGVLIGAGAFLIIGLFHPLVIKGEYHFGVGIWWMFLLAGLAFIALSLITDNQLVSALCGVAGFSSLWGIKEIFEQRRRVQRGWFPSNPKRRERKS